MVTKKYVKTRDVMKVTFTVDFATEAQCVEVAGEFNRWQPEEMKRLKSGVHKLDVELEPGQNYQYRYRIDGQWENDWQADAYSANGYGQENSVVVC